MNIAFVWDWPSVPHQTLTWKDGLARALKTLKDRGNNVGVFTTADTNYDIPHDYFLIKVRKNIPIEVKEFNPDVILVWGDMTRPNIEPLSKLGKPMAICFAGGHLFTDNIDYFDHIFVESEVYRTILNDKGYNNVSIAFGTNTELFAPLPEQTKVFDTIFPATFASWKRHHLYAQATRGLKSLAVGLIQPNGIDKDSWQTCYNNGVVVLPHTPADVLRYLYASSKVCVITSESAGGSQRTVLEAMAMNLPVIVTDSDKFDWALEHVFQCEPKVDEISAFIKILLDGTPEVDTRAYILDNWSHIQYGDALEKGLKSIL